MASQELERSLAVDRVGTGEKFDSSLVRHFHLRVVEISHLSVFIGDPLVRRHPVEMPSLDQFDHILIDEYQDTNALQADIVAALANAGATVTAVGDDAQAIYGFRNATPRNILEFPERFGADLVVLDRNHRSTPSILV